MTTAKKFLSKSSDLEFLVAEISTMVSQHSSVVLGSKQSSMVEGRIKRRISDLGMPDESVYLAYFKKNKETELTPLISLLTTHHSYFFRESIHFDHLENELLPSLIQMKRANSDRSLRVWSAACSRGQEVYSLAMLISNYLAQNAPDFKFEILGTDIDPESVAVARNGVYKAKEIHEVPLEYLGNHWAKGTGEIADFVKARNSIKSSCRFEVLNLGDLNKSGPAQKFDLIFCRNVFIYFTSETVANVTSEMLKRLSPHGRLYLGISETLHGLGLQATAVGPSIYSHTAVATASAPSINSKASSKIEKPAPARPQAPLRVMCVDDSPSIHSLLKKVLVAEHGFEIVATASNGLEASQKLKLFKVDVVTLDIHMPLQDGLTYLQKSFGAGHPPVVMLSSVSREDSDLALKCLEAGASDFVEKPSLSTLTERANEIRAKLRSATKLKSIPVNLELDRKFGKSHHWKIEPVTSLRILVGNPNQLASLAKVLSEIRSQSCPTLFLCESPHDSLAITAQELKSKTLNSHLAVIPMIGELSEKDLCANTLFVCDSKKFFAQASRFRGRRCSILSFGNTSTSTLEIFSDWKDAQVLVEDLGPGSESKNQKWISDVVPLSSFAYMSHSFICGMKTR